MGCMKSEKSAKIKERELIIKLSHEGKTCREIASILDISKSKVSFWVIRHKETGNLNDRPRSGQPTLLTEDKLKEISEKIKKKLQEQKHKAGISSKEVLQILNKETGKTYSLRHAQRLLYKMGFSLITPRVSHIRKDEKAQNKFRKEFKKSFKRTMWAIRS